MRERVTGVEDLADATGYLGFQSETGNVEYRALRLRETDQSPRF